MAPPSAASPVRNARTAQLPPPSAGFRQVRAAHANETAQDYAEAIAELRKRQGGVRVTDLARLLGVSHVTVVRTLTRLRHAGIVEETRDQGKGMNAGIRLTAAGQRVARDASARHKTVVDILCALGVARATAEVDAEGIEHHVSGETMAAMRRFLRTRRGRARTTAA